MIDSVVKQLSEKISTDQHVLGQADAYWSGAQPAAYLSTKSREALGGSLSLLSVNLPKLAVTSLSERLSLAGFRVDGEVHPGLEAAWRRNRLDEISPQAHLDALIYGRSFALVWADETGARVTIESPRQVAVAHDPATREVTAAFKRWAENGIGRGFLYLPDRIFELESAARITGDTFPSTGWSVVREIRNPFGVVPVVPFINSGRLMDTDGISEMGSITGLADALNKLMQDALVASEFYARPRRWATGLEIVEDDEGNPIDPFSNEGGRLWQSESPDTKFGQFEASSMSGYESLIATVTQQIGALTGLPPHYLGLNGDQPASADAIRSSEASLVARAYAVQRPFGRAWSAVAALIIAAETGVDPVTVDVDTLWLSPETRTPAQDADAAAKLVAIGLPLTYALEHVMGWTPAQIEQVRQAKRREQLDGIGVASFAALAAPSTAQNQSEVPE